MCCPAPLDGPKIGSTHQKALVNSPHLFLPGVPRAGWVGEGRDCRSDLVARPSFRCLGARIRTNHPSGSRQRIVVGRFLPRGPFSRAPENRRFQAAVQGSRTPDVAPLVKGSSTRMARDLGASHHRTAGQGGVHSPDLVEARTYSGSLPWSVSNQPNACSTRKGV